MNHSADNSYSHCDNYTDKEYVGSRRGPESAVSYDQRSNHRENCVDSSAVPYKELQRGARSPFSRVVHPRKLLSRPFDLNNRNGKQGMVLLL